VAPLYAALADRYLELHARDRGADRPARRFVSLVGDAELDEGNVWESAIEESLRGIGNVTMIVDLNRQSLDRVIPGIRVHQLAGMFAAAGWQVLEAKYGRRLKRLIAGPGGEVLQRRIDEMSNDYQVLIRRGRSPGTPHRRGQRARSRPPADHRTRPRRGVAGHAGRPRRTTSTDSSGSSMRQTPTGPDRRSSSPTQSRAGGCPSPATR
jgi:hypothetical protein